MEVLYEDNHLIIVNKNCSEIVQGDKTGDTPLSEMLKAWLARKEWARGAAVTAPHNAPRLRRIRNAPPEAKT